jgi:hypothetical protein
MNFSTFLEKQWKLIAGIFVVVVIGGMAIAVMGYQKTKKEKTAQESYFLTEKKFLEAKEKKNAPPVAKEAAKEAPVDLSVFKKDFEKVIEDFPGSKAAQMSAVYLSDILVTEKNFDQALTTLKNVETKDTGLINTLVQQQIASLLADQDKCSDAVQVWQKIIDRKEASFIHNDTKIQQALCYKKMNDTKRAEEILTNLANQKTEGFETSSSSKEAEKYLRLIQFKKASGT